MESTEKKNKIFLLISFISLIALVFAVLLTSGSMPVFAQSYISRTANPSTDYTTEFVCRTYINGKEKYLTYSGGQSMSLTENIEDATFIITFKDNSTINIKRVVGNNTYNLGYGSSTNFSNTTTDWVLENGSPVYTSGTTKRTLAYRTSTFNVGRPYALNNINNSEYYQIYFYTTDEFDAANGRCQWGDGSARKTQLENLAYSLPQPVVQYTISFNANGGSGTMTGVIYNEGTIISIPPTCTFTAPEDKEFDCWKDADGDLIEFPYTVTGDNTFYAYWKDQEIQPSYIAKFGSAATSSDKCDDYTSTWNSTYNGFTVTVQNGNNYNNSWDYIKFGKKNNASIGSITTDAISYAISDITLTLSNATTGKINSI